MQSNNYLSDIKRFLEIAKAAYDKEIETAAARSGITKPETGLLIYLNDNPKFSLVTDSTKIDGFSREDLLSAIGGLKKKSLVSATPDGEAVRIALTGKGGIILKSINGAQKRFADRAFKTISEDESLMLEAVIKKITDNILL